MKNKFGRLLKWGVGTFRIIMANKYVSSAIFFLQGFLYLLFPYQSLNRDARALTLVFALYAFVSIIMALTKNPLAAKGKDLAGGLVKNIFTKKKKTAVKQQELLPQDSLLMDATNDVTSRLDGVMQTLAEKQKKKQSSSAGTAALVAMYTILLIASLALFFMKDNTLFIMHIVIGVFLVLDGFFNFKTTREAMKNKYPVKNSKFSLVLSVLSMNIGILFILLSKSTSVLTVQIGGALLIVKAVGDFVIAIRNRRLMASAKETVQLIKQQSKKDNKDDPPQE